MIAGHCWPRVPATRRWLDPARPPRTRSRNSRRTRTFDLDQGSGAVSAVGFSRLAMEKAMLLCRKLLLALAIIIAWPGIAAAQTTDGKPPLPEQTLLKPEQLDALVAPIALYPDELLANVLAASTYPLEVVQADRWVKAQQEPEGRCAQGGGRQAGVGRQRQGAGRYARCSRDDERQDRLDQESRRCRAGAAARRDGRDPAAARQGVGAQQARHQQAAEGQRSDNRRTRR